MKLSHRVITAGLVAVLAATTCVPVAYATPSQSDVDAAKSSLDQIAKQADDLQNQLETAQDNLQKSQYEINQKQKEIDKLNDKISDTQASLSKSLRSSYKNGPADLLKIILSADSFTDLIGRLYYVDKISTKETDQIKTVQELQNQLKNDKADLEAKKAEQQKQVDKLNAESQELDKKKDEAKAKFDSLNSELKEAIRKQAEEAERARQRAAESNSANVRAASTINDIVGNSSSSTLAPSKPSPSNSGGGLDLAYSLIGKPYVWGAEGPNSFDCSGLVCYVYGHKYGRSTYDMIAGLKAAGRWKSGSANLQVGDLVFPHAGHVGIYIGNGQMIHAPRPGKSVSIVSIYYAGSVLGGGTY